MTDTSPFFDFKSAEFISVEGWIPLHAAAIFDSLLAHQTECKLSGDVMEIGAFKGKSACLLARRTCPDERLFIVDSDLWPSFEPMKKVVSTLRPDARFLNMESSQLESMIKEQDLFRKARFIHIDADHSFEETYNDLENSLSILSKRGVIALDDFFNFQHIQVTEALFAFIERHPRALTLFLAGYNKAYLCRSNAFAFYHAFVRDQLADCLRARGIDDFDLCQSSHYPADVMAFGIGPREDGSIGFRTPDWQNEWQLSPEKRDHARPPQQSDLL